MTELHGVCFWRSPNNNKEPPKLGPGLFKDEYGVVAGPRFCCSAPSIASLNDRILVGISGQPGWRDVGLGEQARLSGAAESLLTAYQRRGSCLFDMLTGSFSVAVQDCAEDLLLLATDRFGRVPVYYCSDDDKLVFASSPQ